MQVCSRQIGEKEKQSSLSIMKRGRTEDRKVERNSRGVSVAEGYIWVWGHVLAMVCDDVCSSYHH